MSRRRAFIRLPTVLAAVALLNACGDSASPTIPPTLESLRQMTVAVSPPTATLTALGATVQLAAVVHDRNARVIARTNINWSTSDPSVAAVDASGLVTAATVNGTARITANIWVIGFVGFSARESMVVTVRRPVASVEVRPPAEIIYVGDTLQFSAEALDESGHAVAVTSFSWESSDTAVASVASAGLVRGVGVGLVRGVAAGLATITVTGGGAQRTVEITVVPNPERVALLALLDAKH